MKLHLWKHCGWWYCNSTREMSGAASGRTPADAYRMWMAWPLNAVL
jgi:hypothetical protein